MHVRLHALTGLLLATLATGLFAQSQTPGPSSPTGAAAPGIAPPDPRQRPTDVSAAGTGVIRGRVVRADTGQPLRKARVSLGIPNTLDVLVATTDANGRYELKALPAGRHTPRAQKNGFIGLGTGQRRPGEPPRPIELGEGQTLERVDFALSPGGVIAGRVLDEAGEPLAGAAVQALRPTYVQGTRRLVSAGARDFTDDLGQFRLFGLAARSYVLSASPPALRPPNPNSVTQGSSGTATYYPGTLAEADAQSIHVEPGGEVTGLTFAIVPVRLAAIVGTVRASDGSVPPSGAWLEVEQEGGTASGGNLIRPDGTFAVPNLSPGRYTVSAWLTPQSDQGAQTEVVLDGADGAVALTFRKGDTARGRFTFDTAEPPPTLQPTSVFISAGRTDPRFQPPTQGRLPVVRDDWTFEVPRLIGRRPLSVTVPQGWAVRSIRLDGRDITDEQLDFNGKDIDGIVVRLTQQISTVGGLVRNERGQTVADARVVLFAEEREKWGPGSRFVRAARPDPDGRFTIRGLPAARYLAVALDFLEPGEETNPETLEQLRRFGKAVALSDGASATVDLTVTAAP